MDVEYREAELEEDLQLENVPVHYSRQAPANRKMGNCEHMNNYRDRSLPQSLG